MRFGRTTIRDPMLHHDGWTPRRGDRLAGATAHRSDVAADEAEEEEEPRCVPMAEWQTTSYPNCNDVHDIDLVRSSGPGSRVFPGHEPEEEEGRRRIASFPPILRERIEEGIADRRPDHPGGKRNARLDAARGIAREERLEFLGQGWFRAAWKAEAEGVPEWDDDEEEFRFDESVVLKTLRCVRGGRGAARRGPRRGIPPGPELSCPHFPDLAWGSLVPVASLLADCW